jgi:hypothetical protein
VVEAEVENLAVVQSLMELQVDQAVVLVEVEQVVVEVQETLPQQLPHKVMMVELQVVLLIPQQ